MHFGIISPPVSGHINPFSAVARELIARGHRVTFFHMPDLEERIRSEGIDFCPIGDSDHPRGSLALSLQEIGKRKGVAALRYTIGAVARTSAMICRDAPAAMRERHVDALLVDQMEPAGGAVAEHLGLPFVTMCNALMINRDPRVPPAFSPWTYSDSWWGRARNQIGYAVSDWMTRPIMNVIGQYRRRWNLPRLRSGDDSFSSLAQISQIPREFDFNRTDAPTHLHYVGPIRASSPKPIPFPWEKLDGRPLIYASLGTLQNGREALFRVFAEACDGLPVQLVITHGGGLTDEQVARLPGRPLVVSYAPQLDVLARASLTLTHAGLNTVLDSLTHGVPLVVVPITYEQPAIARRVEWTGTGRSIALSAATPERIRALVQQVLADASAQASARRLADSIRTAGGVRRAAEIVESAFS